MKFLTTIILMIGVLGLSTAQNKIHLSSPDGKIVFDLVINNKKPSFQISYKGKTVMEKSELDFSINGKALSPKLRILQPKYRQGRETYELIAGKTRNVSEAYQEVTIPMEDEVKVNLVVRVFDDGLAFRYEFLKVEHQDSMVLTDERSTFRFAGNPVVHTLLLPNYTSSHEGFYTSAALSDLKEGELMDMPTLFEMPGPIFVAITEAALVDYAGMYLIKENDVLRSTLSPWPGQTRIKVKASLPHKSPWRVILMNERIGALIESNIITNLNDPCTIQDVSWIKPGKTTFPWWNGNVVPDTLNAPGNNFVTQQYYIDFCARNGLEYHSVVEYGLHAWYVDDGVNFQPGPNADVTKPVPGLDMKEVCDYAASKGVGVRVWVHWAALYPKLDSAFALFEKWGLRGMMVDFMDRDDQQMVNIQNEILKKAARHHLHIQFHGAYKPTGLNRTYPNEFTREGTLNYEINKWDSKGLPPDHDIMIPFTRMLAGSTDYHLGGFRAVQQEKFILQYTRPLMLGTRCHMLAMYVVIENYLGMVCDYPAAYEGQPGFDFIRKVPTIWDETKVIDAKIGEYIIIARRKGTEWFVGGINNHTSRTLSIPLQFLSPGLKVAEIYSDTDESVSQPDHLVVRRLSVTNRDSVSLQMAGGGGLALHLKPE